MDVRDNVEFRNRLIALAELFDVKLSPQRQALYFEGLRDLPFDGVAAAMNTAVKTCTFFPKPAELRTAALGSLSDAATGAWSDVLKEVRRVGYMGHPVLSEDAEAAVWRVWGSWRQLCETLPVGGPELMGWQKRFEESFIAEVKAQDRPTLAPMPARGRLRS